jgi:hypothetical protein
LDAISDEVSAHRLITPDEMTFFMTANQRKLDFSCVDGDISRLLHKLPATCPVNEPAVVAAKCLLTH